LNGISDRKIEDRKMLAGDRFIFLSSIFLSEFCQFAGKTTQHFAG